MAETLRETKKAISIKLSYKEKERLDDLFESWDFETKKFIRGILKSHLDNYYKRKKPRFSDKFVRDEFKVLKNPDEFKSWQKRFESTGETSAKKAYEQLLKKELTFNRLAYLVNKLDQEIKDVVIPDEIVQLFHNVYLAHLRKEMSVGKGVPKKPFIMVIGPTGSGKTHTIKGAIEQAIFDNELIVRKDYESERDRILEKHPFLRNIPFLEWINPPKELVELIKEADLREKLDKYKRMLKLKIFRKHAQKKLKELEKKGGEIDKDYESFKVDYTTISPHEIQTMWYGETGNKFKDAMGSADIPSIRHILEAHGILEDPKKMRSDDIQAKTLSATVNKVMDEIMDGQRDCIFIADTHSPEEIAPDTYRRFDELGAVIDVSKYWRDRKNLEKLINLESKRYNIRLDASLSLKITDKVFAIFNDKSLILTPAYVRKLISSIIEQKNDLKLDYFDDERLIRNCFENVARNTHGDLFKKVVKRPRAEEGYAWEDYQGKIKEDFLEKVTSALFYGGKNKGVVLIGPPGSGKTFLPQVIAATHPEITYISVKLDDLSDSYTPIESIIRNLDAIYNIGKMCAPTLIVINEAEAVVKKRNTQMPDPYDKVTNKVLDILDGEESVKGTFTTLTTNLYENLDSAVTRPGRLEVMSVDGKLAEKEIYKIIEREIGNVPRDEEITDHAIYTIAKGISNVPAGYVDFVRKLKDLRNAEFQIIQHYKMIFERKSKDSLEDFIKFNAKTIVRVLEALFADSKIISQSKKDIRALVVSKGYIYQLMNGIDKPEDYKLRKSHLINAKIELMKNPQKKALKGLDDFLSDELSKEPQVGKIVGAGYGDNMGWLVPINSVLKFKGAGEGDIIVTGVTKGSALQNVDYTEMAIQSATEALTLNIHYFQNLLTDDENYKHLDASAIIGTLLKNRLIHHQMESVNYMGGGPSAGFALSINTLSVLLEIPICNDFGITGAPAIRGTSKDKAGSSVMIGGEDKKSERVLLNLRRMYVPKKNYDAIPLDQQESYWNEGKIIIPVGDYREVIAEVLYFGKESMKILDKLIDSRIEYNKERIIKDESELTEKGDEIKRLEITLKEIAESEIKRRLIAIYNFCTDQKRDEFSSLEAIFTKYDPLKK